VAYLVSCSGVSGRDERLFGFADFIGVYMGVLSGPFFGACHSGSSSSSGGAVVVAVVCELLTGVADGSALEAVDLKEDAEDSAVAECWSEPLAVGCVLAIAAVGMGGLVFETQFLVSCSASMRIGTADGGLASQSRRGGVRDMSINRAIPGFQASSSDAGLRGCACFMQEKGGILRLADCDCAVHHTHRRDMVLGRLAYLNQPPALLTLTSATAINGMRKQ